MKYKRSELSECELVTMKCIWDLGGSVTCPEVIEELKNNYGMEYKVTTVYTFLSKLVEKGFVVQEKDKLTKYKAVRSEQDYRNEVLQKTSEFWFAKSVPQFISSLFQSSDEITDEEEAEIDRLIEELKKKKKK